ncbi:Hypothetical protein CINCED_3A014124 [Cinara cedri]|uniref:Uncharacterized protein n=1 Tax=Cinara cedri TaxID=506608 RepID=A0A5E4N187_9HEMI|nr:Hypothetical protein CINCED_3A014124 [Cinara cedri]
MFVVHVASKWVRIFFECVTSVYTTAGVNKGIAGSTHVYSVDNDASDNKRNDECSDIHITITTRSETIIAIPIKAADANNKNKRYLIKDLYCASVVRKVDNGHTPLVCAMNVVKQKIYARDLNKFGYETEFNYQVYIERRQETNKVRVDEITSIV